MKTSTRIISTTFAAVSLAAASLAFAHPGQGMGMGPGMRGPQTAASLDTRLAEWKSGLKITAAQEPAWNRYQALVLQQAQSAEAVRSAMQAQMQDPKAAGTVDHAAQHQAMDKVRQEHPAARIEARNELLAVLTPEQKALFEQRQGAGYGRHMSMRGPRW